jgi:hypothetical protein
LGHDARAFPLPQYDKSLGFKIYLGTGFKPDFCFLMNAGSLREGTPFWNKEVLKCPLLVLEAGDEPQAYRDHIELSNNSDLVLSPDIRCVGLYKKRNINALWWTHWCDQKIFFPEPDKIPKYEVVSSMYGTRRDTLQISSILKDTFVNKTGLVGEENGDWLKNGKIILQEARYGEITRRVFEGMGCKKLVITNRLSEETKIQDFFIDKEDIVYYDSPQHCIELINFYLKNDHEREKIANKGYEKIIKFHTATKRAQIVLEKIEEIL